MKRLVPLLDRLSSMRHYSWAARDACYLLILLPVAVAFMYVARFGVNVPVWDDWGIVPFIEGALRGGLRPSDFFTQHVENRMVFPRIVMLAIALITGFNTIAHMLFVLMCFFGTLTLLFYTFVGQERTIIKLLLFVPVASWIFSLKGHQNMLWGWQVSFAMTQFFSVAALLTLSRGRYISAALCATVASFSTTQGLLLWPVGLLLLLGKWKAFASWAAMGVVVWTVYFSGYHSPPRTPSALYLLEHPVYGIRFALTLLGSSLTWDQDLAPYLGVALVLFAGVALALGRAKYPFWSSLIVFSLLTVASTTAGRSGFGIEWATRSRYASFTLLLVVAVYCVLVTLWLNNRRSPARLAVALAALILVMGTLPAANLGGLERGRTSQENRERAARILINYQSATDAQLKLLHPSPPAVRKWAPLLEEWDYSVFANSHPSRSER